MGNYKTWITASQLIERWKVAPRAIYDAVRDGLMAYEERQCGPEVEVYDHIVDAMVKKRSFALAKIKPNRFLDYFAARPEAFVKGWFNSVFFKMEDILAIEAENETLTDEPLSGRERIRLAQLEAQVKRTDEMMAALSYSIEFCHERGEPVKRDIVAQELSKEYKINRTSETFRKIWSNIPQKYKMKGRPSKKVT